jgi:hypothetical protein
MTRAEALQAQAERDAEEAKYDRAAREEDWAIANAACRRIGVLNNLLWDYINANGTGN